MTDNTTQVSAAEAKKALFKFINETPLAQSLLYDINLLPEQLEEGSQHWGYMLSVVAHLQAALASQATPHPEPSSTTSPATQVAALTDERIKEILYLEIGFHKDAMLIDGFGLMKLCRAILAEAGTAKGET